MTSKLLWNSFCCLIVIVVCNSCMHKFGLLRYRQRKCVQNRPLLKFDITFRHRQECLKSVEESQSQRVPISELNLNTVEEINYRGYNATTYTILSKDGYYSAVYRISGRKNSPPKLGKRSVLVFHGAGAGSASWIIQPGSRNIALTLADAGYEVWLANARGTIPSKKHVHLDADKDLQYWDFSFDDFGTKDLPLLVDLILRETGTDKIYYVCHSMGCAAYLTGLVNVPDLNDKIKAGFLMAPSAYYGNVYNPTFTLFPPILGTPLQHIVFRLFGGTFSAEPNAIQTFLGLTPEKICSWKYIRCGICDNFLFALYGADPQQLNYTDLPNIIKKLQDSTPLKIFFHYQQNDEACDFRKYDYGRTRNLVEYYGSSIPPRYNLSQMAVPTYIFYGENDNLATPENSERTRDAIPSKYMKGFYKVEWPLFNHVDFLMAKDADILVYHKIRDIIHELELQDVLQ